MKCLERQDKATQHNRKTKQHSTTQLAQRSYFQRKNSCLGWYNIQPTASSAGDAALSSGEVVVDSEMTSGDSSGDCGGLGMPVVPPPLLHSSTGLQSMTPI